MEASDYAMSGTKPKRLIFDSKLKAEKDYWLQKLSGDLAESSIPPDFERPARRSGAKSTVTLHLPLELSGRLIEFADASLFSLYTTLMSALKAYLFRCAGRGRVVVGSPPCMEGADPTPAENALAIVDDLSGDLSFRQLLGRVRATLEEAYANQNYPFGRLASDLGLDAFGERCPTFDIALRLEGLHGDLPELQNDITLSFNRDLEGLTCMATYGEELFRRETVERLAQHLINLLDEAIENAATPISDIEFLSEAERKQFLIEWNQTASHFPFDCAVQQGFVAHAAQSPDATALVVEGYHLSYGELDQRSNQLARYLQAHGVGPEVCVAICMQRSPEVIVSILAVLKAGGAYVPLAPSLPTDRLSYMLEDSQALVLITHERLLDRFAYRPSHILCLNAEWAAVSSYSKGRLAVQAGPANLAYVIYTSGSTGRPKGVMIERRGFANLVQAQIQAFGVRADSHVLQFASLGFDASVSEIFMAICSGATLRLGQDRGPDLAAALRREMITVVTLPPAVLATLDAEPLPALESLISAGEVCPSEVVERWGRGRRFFNAYGPTESSVCASLLECGQGYRNYAPIGRPLANTQLYVLDAGRRLAPVRVEGELYIGGVGLARGYLKRSDLTAEKFIPNTFSQEPGARLYVTGDSVRYLDDGTIEFVGRRDRQVKVRGYRIELGEIEVALRRQEGVKDAVVTLREDERDENRLVAYIVGMDSEAIRDGALRGSLQRQLPDYMIPSVFVALEELPLTVNGKVDHRALPEPQWAQSRMIYNAPVTETEVAVASIWADLLSVDTVGRDDDFFKLGGHSLLASQVVARVREEFGLELPVHDLFEHSTVSDFAQYLDTVRWIAQDTLPMPRVAGGGREEGEL